MKKIFLSGDKLINDEIESLLAGKAQIVSEPDKSVELIIETTNFPLEAKKNRFMQIDERCSPVIPVLTSSLCIPVSEQTTITKFPNRLIGIGLYNSFSKRNLLEIAPSKITEEHLLKNAEDFLSSVGLNFVKVPDRAGLVFPRILAMIINEAAQVYSENIASREDIDTAMMLGTNYPFGPLTWADNIGIDLVYNILSSLHVNFGEDRYRPHPILKEMVDLKFLGVKTKRGFYEY
jgi:3-hydroxybutyryl-CoA dehydrogenase